MADERVRDRGRLLRIGDTGAVERAARILGLDLAVRSVQQPEDAEFTDGTLAVLDTGALDDQAVEMGTVSALAGKAAAAAIEKAVSLAVERRVVAVVTAPISKEAIWAAGASHLGHTEMLAELTGVRRSTTMFLVRGLKIFFATPHVTAQGARLR